MKIEIKVRYQGDNRDWENIPVHYIESFGSTHDARQFIEHGLWFYSRVVEHSPQILEVRYNRVGSLQGRYVRNIV